MQFAGLASTVLSIFSSVKQGQQEQAAADFRAVQYDDQAVQFERQAKEFEYQGGQAKAASQRSAVEDRRQATLAQSRLRAMAGGGGLDPTIVNLSADLAGEGEYRALTSLYEGDERARAFNLEADNSRANARQATMGGIAERAGGRSAVQAGYIGGITSVISSKAWSPMYEKYKGTGGPAAVGGYTGTDPSVWNGGVARYDPWEIRSGGSGD